MDILSALSLRLSNTEIRARLYVGETTVKTHGTTVLCRLGLRDRIQAVLLAYECRYRSPGGGSTGMAANRPPKVFMEPLTPGRERERTVGCRAADPACSVTTVHSPSSCASPHRLFGQSLIPWLPTIRRKSGGS